MVRTTGSVPSEAEQSRLCYFRPLRKGDVLTYEFFYEPGAVMVHPAFDRLVFLCEQEGVRLHWMTRSGDDPLALPADNRADEPECRRGPKELPLLAGKWNAMKLSLDGGKVGLELNGQAIFERTLEPDLSRQFSFFHYKDQTAAKARNVTLKGRWPESLSPQQTDDLTAPGGGDDSVASRRARRALIDESFYALEGARVAEEARSLAPVERYERLAAWVLPAEDRPVWRLGGEPAASFPAPVCGKEEPTAAKAGEASSGSRVQSGGELAAPALRPGRRRGCRRQIGRAGSKDREPQAVGGRRSG